MLGNSAREEFFKNYLEKISGFSELIEKQKSVVEYFEQCAWEFQTEDDMYWINHFRYTEQKQIELLKTCNNLYNYGEEGDKIKYNGKLRSSIYKAYFLEFKKGTPQLLIDLDHSDTDELEKDKELNEEIYKKYPDLKRKIDEYRKELERVVLKTRKFIDILCDPEITKTIIKTYYPEIV